jgi:hypothetical protein
MNRAIVRWGIVGLFTVMAVLGVEAGSSEAAWRSGGHGYGHGYRSGYGQGYRHGHGHHGHGHARYSFGFVIGGPAFWYPYAYPYPYYAYPYAYPYGYPYPYPYYRSGVALEAPQVYVEQAPAQQQQYWYYCKDPQGYYPYVQECPGGWTPVAPRPAER